MLNEIKLLKQDMKLKSSIDNKIKRGCSVNIYPIYEYWAEIGSKDIFKKLINKK